MICRLINGHRNLIFAVGNSLLGAAAPSYTVDGDTLRLSDGDLTLTFLRVGGNLPV